MGAANYVAAAVAVALALGGCADRTPLDGGTWTDDDATVLRIVEAYQAGDCQTVLEQSPGYATTVAERQHTVTYVYGRCLYDAGRYDEALEVLGRIATSNPPGRYTDEALYYVARTLYRQHDDQEAADTFALYLERFGGRALDDDARYFLGKTLVRLNLFEEALAAFEALEVLATASDTRRDGARYQRGKVYATLAKRDPSGAVDWRLQAREIFEGLRDTMPASKYADNAAYSLAGLAEDEGRLGQAGAAYAAFEDDWPDSSLRHLAHYRRGRVAEKLGDLTGAIDFYRSYEVLYPGQAFADNARYRRGRIAYGEAKLAASAGDPGAPRLYEDSETLFLGVLDDFPETSLRHRVGYYLGRSRYGLRAYEPALAAFAITLEAPTSIYADNATYYSAKSHYNLGRYEDAIAWFGRVATEYRGSSYEDDARYFEGRAHQRSAQLDKALAVFESLLDDFADSSYRDNAYRRRVEILALLGRCDLAGAELNRMEADTPTSTLIGAANTELAAGCP